MAFIFVPLLVLTTLLAIAVGIHASRCVVVIVEETAAGNEEVVWSDEPIMDWIWMGGYLAWLIGVWLVPAFLVARIATQRMAVEGKPWVYVGCVLVTFWLTFPISLLSTMSAESRWAIFHPGLFRRLAANFGHVATFYLVSALLVWSCVPLTVGIWAGDDPFTLVAGALGPAISIVLMARMLGRLANLARLADIRLKKRRPRPSTKGVATADPWEVPQGSEENGEEYEPPRAETETPRFIQPSDLPALHTPYEGDVTGYNVSFGDEAKKPVQTKRRRAKHDEPVPMRRDEEAEQTMEREKEESRKRAAEIVPDKVEMDRLRRKKEKIPKLPPLSGIGLFLFQPHVAVNATIMAFGFGIVGLCVRGLIAFWPF